MIVYYSSASGNTQRFVERLEVDSIRLPINADEPMPILDQPYVLVCPTYADGEGRGAVPKSVIKVLNHAENRAHLKGVIASGNRNFGELFAQAGKKLLRINARSLCFIASNFQEPSTMFKPCSRDSNNFGNTMDNQFNTEPLDYHALNAMLNLLDEKGEYPARC
ncbi:class Ib ribonucleoside-diphosphate reductase assembly flavoprotein NrdI [Vibrio sinaloensis]|nr:class Ib ribonucleoside-diphosphate reductase assembly flavoprotein NrdI [Vibrio sinaloensis]